MLNAIKDIDTSGAKLKDNRKIKLITQSVIQIQLNNIHKACGTFP